MYDAVFLDFVLAVLACSFVLYLRKLCFCNFVSLSDRLPWLYFMQKLFVLDVGLD